jgi:hypothetical protein
VDSFLTGIVGTIEGTLVVAFEIDGEVVELGIICSAAHLLKNYVQSSGVFITWHRKFKVLENDITNL